MDGLLGTLVRSDPPGARIDSASSLLQPAPIDVDVLHVGKTAVVLRPLDAGDDDIVVTDARAGLMPGGLSLPETEFRRWRDLLPTRRERILGDSEAFGSADRVRLHIERAAPDPDAVVAAIAHLPDEAAPSQFTVGIIDGRHAAAAAVSSDPRAVEIVAANVVGLGMGSTPAGDDVLVGVCAGLRVSGHDDAAGALAHASVALAERTTRSSRLFLRAAADGRFSERVHWLARSLDSEGDAIRAVRQLSSWGGTSGVDLAAGFLGAQAHLLDLPAASRRRGAA